MSSELTGKIKRVMYGKGFGFIVGDDGNEYFFHAYEVERGGFDHLLDGARVRFFPEAHSYTTKDGVTHEGWKALRVRPESGER